MELLVLKADNDYFKFLEDGFERCGMNKASVYPLAELAKVRELRQTVIHSGFAVKIKKLTILEEDFQE